MRPEDYFPSPFFKKSALYEVKASGKHLIQYM